MSWRTVVITNHSKLDLKLNSLVIRSEEVTKIHLSEIAVLIVENTATAITSALLSELTKHKIKVIFCDEKRNPIAELMPCYGSHDTSVKVKAQAAWTSRQKAVVWTEIIKNKIMQQSLTLKLFGFYKESEMLQCYINELILDDKTNREGHAAKVYFNAMFGIDFTRRCQNATNAALNYGYAILLSAFNREVSSNGYITQLGLHHDNTYNQFNLSCDLIEPFRTLVDKIVKKENFSEFGLVQKHILVNVLNKSVKIDEQKHFLLNAIKIYCKSVFDAIEECDEKIIRFYEDELEIYESNSNV